MTQELHALRQRLLIQGAASLSDVDLLGVTLGSPYLARSLSRAFPRWSELGRAEISSVPRFHPARATQVLALVELSRRINSRPVSIGAAVSCAADVAAIYAPRLGHLHQEVFLALALDTRHRVICEHEIARGTLNSVEVHPREVFRKLVRDGAAAALLVHNHPSGDPEPSYEDRRLSTRLCDVGQLLGITVLDFLVVGGGRVVSFAERGWIYPEVQS